MSRWGDIATWAGPAADNHGDGDWAEREPADRMTGHRGLVLHIAEGTYTGTISWIRNPGSDISSHWVLAKDGRCVQLVDTDDRPWTQGAGNAEWLSVECEGYAGEALTAAQVEVCARLLARANTEYGVPLQVADSPTGRGLGWHGMGGAAWGGHTGCPGPRIVAQRPQIIARAAALLEGDDVLTDQDLERIVASVTSGLRRGAWERGYLDATLPAGYRGGPTLTSLDERLASLASRPAVQLTDQQLAAIGAQLAEQMEAGLSSMADGLASIEANVQRLVAAIGAAARAAGEPT